MELYQFFMFNDIELLVCSTIEICVDLGYADYPNGLAFAPELIGIIAEVLSLCGIIGYTIWFIDYLKAPKKKPEDSENTPVLPWYRRIWRTLFPERDITLTPEQQIAEEARIKASKSNVAFMKSIDFKIKEEERMAKIYRDAEARNKRR